MKLNAVATYPCPMRVKRRNTLCEQMFSAVLPISDIRRERASEHAEGVPHTLCKCDHEIGTPVQHPLIPDRAGGGAVPLPLRFTPASFC
jgi:hypothetical protein